MASRNGYFLFWGTWPSNWTRSPFAIEGKTYTCVEQYMMAEKARLFMDPHTWAKIMATPEPDDQKRYGREVKNYDDATWAAARYAVVLKGTLEKYRQNPALKALLLDTGNDIFVEASPDDRIWGIGMRAAHPDATDETKWRGLNLLGKAITEARGIIRLEER